MTIQNYTEEIQQKIDGLPPLITDDERQMIHAAMSTSFATGTMAQGHWCKCTSKRQCYWYYRIPRTPSAFT